MSFAADDADRTNLHRPVLSGLSGRPVAALDSRSIGQLAAINPLVAAANPLLMTVTSLRPGSAPANVEAFRTRLLDMVKEFDAACVAAGIQEESAHLARYALCTVIDEIIQRTAWSHAANWAQRSLSIHFFKDNKGGEKFFVILDKLVQSPSKYAWLLQLFYVCLSLGFMGRYLMRDATGRQEINDLRDRLFQQVVRPALPEAERALSPHWRGLEIGARQFRGFTALWVAIGVSVLLCLVAYAGYRFWLAAIRDDVGIGALALSPVPAAARVEPPPPARPRLPQLLLAEIDAKKLQVKETVAESKVTLASGFTFASGSADLSPAAVEVIEKIAAAMDQFEGQILVTGHTDDVPARTLKYPSNYELSRARARSVADLMRSKLRVPARVTDEGRADSEPLPAEDNDKDKARRANRRVEITLRVSAAGK